MALSEKEWHDLMSWAHDAAGRAYAPYSKFYVGAALKCEDGTLVQGCNVENGVYPLGICAERAALAGAVSSGQKKFVALALSVPGVKLSTPCGACRQVLFEFCEALPILVEARESGERKLYSLADLLPDPFRLEID